MPQIKLTKLKIVRLFPSINCTQICIRKLTCRVESTNRFNMFIVFHFIILRYLMTEATSTIENIPDTPPVIHQQETQSLQQYFNSFRGQISECWKWSLDQQHEWRNWDQQLSRKATNFKEDYILSIGDLPQRSIFMAVSGGLTYKLISLKTTSLIRRSRNLAISFLINGWIFVPQLFNPLLPKRD